MRYVLSVVILSLFFQLSFASTGPELKVLSHEWDFGKVEQGSSKEMVFSIKNTGFDELIIDNMHACCGYSLKGISSWNIAPGGKAEITLVCDASRKPLGQDSKYITILSNSTKNPHMQVAVKADIQPGVVQAASEEKIQTPAKVKISTEHIAKIPSMEVDDVYAIMSAGRYVFILDVREKEECAHKYIPNSIRFSRSSINENESDLENILSNIDKRTVIVVCCAGGIRSSYITAKLKSLGYNAYNMEGGISAWEKSGHPLAFGPAVDGQASGIPIELEEAYEYYFVVFKDKTVWIDLRDTPLYKEAHIKDAVNIPAYKLKDKLDLIPRDKNVVLYCEGVDCDLGQVGAKILIENGYKRGMIRVFSGGMAVWKEAGYPTDSIE